MGDASHVASGDATALLRCLHGRLRDVEGDASLPNRLLFAGLPLTIAAGALVGYLIIPNVGWAVAALIATILAPTDAALGLAVVPTGPFRCGSAGRPRIRRHDLAGRHHVKQQAADAR